jgi:hypothetical protein
MSASDQKPGQSSAELLNVAWLDVATKELIFPARERIKLEIAAHFEDAVERYRSEGATEPEAKTQALLDLGDPGDAAKRFRKEHLTESEMQRIDGHFRYYRGVVRGVLAPVVVTTMALVFAFGLFDWHGAVFASLVVPSGTFLCRMLAGYFLVNGRNSKPNLAALFWLEFLADASMSIAIGLAMGSGNTFGSSTSWGSRIWIVFALMFFLPSLIRSALVFRLWRKLRRTCDVWQELPRRPSAN